MSSYYIVNRVTSAEAKRHALSHAGADAFVDDWDVDSVKKEKYMQVRLTH
jgi:hypothetical protein